MKYLLSSKKYGNMASFEYDQDSLIKMVKIEGDLTESQRRYILEYCTEFEDLFNPLLPMLKTKIPDVKIEEVLGDLSFENFWEQYGFKKGKKDRVRRKWEAMEEADQYKALSYIKKYKFFLAERPHIQQKYPETYLNTAEWNN